MDPNTQIISDQNPLIGKTVAGRYEVISLLGHGAMGAVYKAKHVSLGRPFAVKTMHATVKNDPKMLKRFQQEAQAMSLLTHPNIIHIADYGQTDEGDPFLVMEFLEGLSLADHIKHNGPMGIAQSLPIFAQIADALEHAHRQNLIHRDLKPSNIMLTGEDRDFVKVVDFGIAKVVANEEESQHLTATGEVFGSPLYMSPEQCMGSQLDVRSDIYSLGCLMYEALSAKPPLKGTSFVQTAYKHMNEMPDPLSQVRSDMCPQFEALIFSCLAKKPEERPQTMTAVRDRLRELIGMHCSDSQQNKALGDSGLTSAVQALPTAPPLTPAQAHKYGIIASVAFLVLMISVVGWTLATYKEPPKPPTTVLDTPTGSDSASFQGNLNTTSTVSVASPEFEKNNPGAPQEIDVIAVYSAKPPAQVVGQTAKPHSNEVVVTVSPKREPATLILFSFDPVHWNVKPLLGAEIKKVLASGFHPQDVVGASCSDVTHVCKKNKDEKAFDTSKVFNRDNGNVVENREEAYKNIQAAVKQLLGPDAEIRHFKGKYYGDNFEI